MTDLERLREEWEAAPDTGAEQALTSIAYIAALEAEVERLKRREMLRNGYFCEGCGRYAEHDQYHNEGWVYDMESGIHLCPQCVEPFRREDGD